MTRYIVVDFYSESVDPVRRAKRINAIQKVVDSEKGKLTKLWVDHMRKHGDKPSDKSMKDVAAKQTASAIRMKKASQLLWKYRDSKRR